MSKPRDIKRAIDTLPAPRIHTEYLAELALLEERASKAKMLEERVKELERENLDIFRKTGCFKGFVEGDVQERFFEWWMDIEGIPITQAIDSYCDNNFAKLASRLTEPCWFIPDDYDVCFEYKDHTIAIPQKIITRL